MSRTVIVSPIDREPTFRAGNPEVLFEGQYVLAGASFSRRFDIAPDGQRFLMVKRGGAPTDDATAPDLILVLNWFDELQRLVPTP